MVHEQQHNLRRPPYAIVEYIEAHREARLDTCATENVQLQDIPHQVSISSTEESVQNDSEDGVSLQELFRP